MTVSDHPHRPAISIDVVIVNWNSGTLLGECLRALAASTIVDRLNVVVIDNASSDGSATDLSFPPLHLHIIANGTNRGFAAACNQGADAAEAPYILFLNPDVRVEADAIGLALGYLDAHAPVGVLGIKLIHSDGRTARSCARRPTMGMLLLRSLFLDRLLPTLVPPHFLLEWDHLDTREVEQVMGAFLMIRRRLFDQAGGFDERFFVYYEDLDLCLRVIDGGSAVVHLADATASHIGGGTTAAVMDRRFAYETTSRVLFAAKHHGAAAAFLLAASISMFEIPIRFFHAALAVSPRRGWLVLRGACMFWRGLPRLVCIIGRPPTASRPQAPHAPDERQRREEKQRR